ncbi:MAG TPA: alginate lyase family protein [Treponemataceae bacterium]|nr:alginate lyase family protein [Treponemataceae bacterium]
MKTADFFNQNKRFFFGSRDAAAAYVKQYCKDELDHVIKTADNTVQQKFIFDLRWDMERTYEPVIFTKEIDWLYQPSDDPEWVFAFNRMRFWVCLGQAYAVTGDEKYAACFTKQLCHWIDTVKKDHPHNAKAWRTIETGLRLEYWLKAVCYFKGSVHLTDEVMTKFEHSIVEHAEFIMSVYNSFNYMSNWGVLANHGLFLAGAMMPDLDDESKKRNDTYIKTSLYRLSQITEVQIYDDGMQWEQSTMYHNEVCHDLLDVVIIAKRNGIELPYPIEEKTRAMCYADSILQKPNGHELCMGDSDDIDQRDIVSKGAYIFKDPVLKSSSYEKLDFDTVWDLGFEAVEDFEKIQKKHPEQLSLALSESGHVCFRSSREKDAVFFHFFCGTLGAGHGHADKLHIDVFSNGEDILLDPGRFTYVDSPDRYKYKDASAHNTCTIDGKSCYTFKDSWGCSSLDKAVNFRWKDAGDYAFCEGGHLGYMLNNSKPVYAERRVLYIKPGIFIINDVFYAQEKHVYDMYYHVNNLGRLETEGDNTEKNIHRLKYTSDLNTAQFVILGKNIISTIMEGNVSRHYNEEESSPVIKASWEADGFTSVFTVIGLNSDRLSVKKVPVLSNYKNAVFPDSMIEALEVDIPGSKKAYTAVFAHQEYASPTDTFCAGGITYDELQNAQIPLWKPGNTGNASGWGAVNSKTGCTGFGRLTVFDRGPGSADTVEGEGFRTGKMLAV